MPTTQKGVSYTAYKGCIRKIEKLQEKLKSVREENRQLKKTIKRTEESRDNWKDKARFRLSDCKRLKAKVSRYGS